MSTTIGSRHIRTKGLSEDDLTATPLGLGRQIPMRVVTQKYKSKGTTVRRWER